MDGGEKREGKARRDRVAPPDTRRRRQTVPLAVAVSSDSFARAATTFLDFAEYASSPNIRCRYRGGDRFLPTERRRHSRISPRRSCRSGSTRATQYCTVLCVNILPVGLSAVRFILVGNPNGCARGRRYVDYWTQSIFTTGLSFSASNHG